jgi:hypothetical protein
VRKFAVAATAGVVTLFGVAVWPVAATQFSSSSEKKDEARAQAARADGAQDVGGGSNYNWFDLKNCDREKYGVVNNFDKGRDVIPGQLAKMRESGQDKLRFGIFHRHGPDSGTLMDSTGGRLSEKNTENLRDFLAAVKKAGFKEISVSMHVNGDNNPNDWKEWNEDYYKENLDLIRYIRPILKESGIHYRIDLGAELIPDPSQEQTLAYTQRLWKDYTTEFGKDDTVGFSVIGMVPQRIAQLRAVYGDNPPYLFDFHFYGSPERGDEHSQFVNADKQLNDMGYKQGMVVSETYYNDKTAADGIKRAMDETGRRVYWVTQWPLTVQRTCPDVDVTPPSDFDNFTKNGFGQAP